MSLRVGFVDWRCYRRRSNFFLSSFCYINSYLRSLICWNVDSLRFISRSSYCTSQMVDMLRVDDEDKILTKVLEKGRRLPLSPSLSLTSAAFLARTVIAFDHLLAFASDEIYVGECEHCTNETGIPRTGNTGSSSSSSLKNAASLDFDLSIFRQSQILQRNESERR